jgi:protein O-mannosyl-transferase
MTAKMSNTILLMLIAFMLAGASYIRNIVFHDEIALYEDVISKGTNRARVHNNLGKGYASRAMREKAMEHFLIALSLKPDFAEAHLNLGLIYLDQGAIEQARDEIGMALLINPNLNMARQLYNYISRLN